MHISEKNKKRDIRDWYHQTNSERYQHEVPVDNTQEAQRRGDIPIMHGDCEGKYERRTKSTHSTLRC